MNVLKKLKAIFFCGIFLSLMPLEGYAQFEQLMLLGSAAKLKDIEEENAKMSEFEYNYLDNEYSKQGHSYYSKKKINTFINKIGKIMGEYIDCNLQVSSGMSLEGERLRLAFRYYTTDTDLSKYLKGIVKTYGSKGYGKMTGMSLTMEMGGFVNGEKKIDQTLTFTNVSLDVGISGFSIIFPLANVNMSGSVKQRIAMVRAVLSTKPLLQLKMDGWLYRLKDVETQEFFKPVFEDLEKKRPIKDSGGSYSYSKGMAGKQTAKVSHYGTQNNIPLADGLCMPYIREDIKKHDQCRTGAITKSGPGVAVWGRNEYSCNEHCHKGLVETLEACNENNYTINDVALTESGGYLVIFEDNRFAYFGVGSEAMCDWLIKYDNDNKKITSVAFTDEGRWAIVTENSYVADDHTGKVIDEAKEKYGYINSVSLSGNSVVVCCDGGVYYKNAPKKLIERLNAINFLPKVIKFTDNGLLLITDGDKQYNYCL